MKLGDKIRVNKGSVETLIKIELPYGLFITESGRRTVRNIVGIKEHEIVKEVGQQQLNFNAA